MAWLGRSVVIAATLAACDDGDSADAGGAGSTQSTTSSTTGSQTTSSQTTSSSGGASCTDALPADDTLTPATITITNASTAPVFIERARCANQLLALDGKGMLRTWSQWRCEDARAETCENLPPPDCIDNEAPRELAPGESLTEPWDGGVSESLAIPESCEKCMPPIGAPPTTCVRRLAPAAGTHEIELSILRGAAMTPEKVTATVTLPAAELTIVVD